MKRYTLLVEGKPVAAGNDWQSLIDEATDYSDARHIEVLDEGSGNSAELVVICGMVAVINGGAQYKVIDSKEWTREGGCLPSRIVLLEWVGETWDRDLNKFSTHVQIIQPDGGFSVSHGHYFHGDTAGDDARADFEGRRLMNYAVLDTAIELIDAFLKYADDTLVERFGEDRKGLEDGYHTPFGVLSEASVMVQSARTKLDR